MPKAIAAMAGSDQPHFVDVPPPTEPGTSEVLCRTLQLGVCGTDREILASKQPWLPQDEDFLILGHECLARVEAVGDGVTGLKAGQLVVPTVRRPLVESSIRPDFLSFGDYTERGIVRQHGFSQPLWLERPEFLIPVEQDFADVAVFAEPQSVAEKAVNEALLLQQARLGTEFWNTHPPRVLVTGQGPIAFAALIAGIARGWPVTMAGRDQDDTFRVSLARELGATDYLPMKETRLDQRHSDADGFDLLLECTGSDDVLMLASRALAARGVAVWLGASRHPKPASHNVDRLMRNAVMKNHLHLGSVNAADRDFVDGLDNLRSMNRTRPEALRRMFTTHVPFEAALDEYTARRKQSVKVVIQYPDS